MAAQPAGGEPVLWSRPRSVTAPTDDVDRAALRRRFSDALDELRIVGRKLDLPPFQLSPRSSTDGAPSAPPDVLARYDRQIADLDALVAGPRPVALHRLAAPADPDAFLVTNLIRPGTTVMLTGPPGSGKSWAARQLAFTAAAGLPHFLTDRYAIPHPLRVTILDEDNGPEEEWRRDETLLAHLDITRTDLNSVERLSLGGVMLDQPGWQAWLRGQLRAQQTELLICDPISEMHGGKELREDPLFRSLLGFLKQLKVEFANLATVLVHHTRKAAPGDRSSPRSLEDVRGQWGQTPDVVALMWPLPERKVQWEVHKRVQHSKLILEAIEAGPLVVASDETDATTRMMNHDHQVLAAIQAGAEDWEQIHHATAMSKSGIYKTIARLAAAGMVTKRAPYQLLEAD